MQPTPLVEVEAMLAASRAEYDIRRKHAMKCVARRDPQDWCKRKGNNCLGTSQYQTCLTKPNSRANAFVNKERTLPFHPSATPECRPSRVNKKKAALKECDELGGACVGVMVKRDKRNKKNWKVCTAMPASGPDCPDCPKCPEKKCPDCPKCPTKSCPALPQWMQNCDDRCMEVLKKAKTAFDTE